MSQPQSTPDHAPAVISDRVLTVPNALSALRILLVPVFLVLVLAGLDLAALIVIVVSSLSDFLDGIIARRFSQVTKLGQLLDPAADRLFIFAAVIALAVRNVVPWWVVVVIVGRDVFLAILGIVLARHGYGPLPVHHLGKVATFALFYALPLLVFGQAFPAIQSVSDPLGWAFTLWGAFLYWWAGILYLRQTYALTHHSSQTASGASDTLGVQRRTTDG
ncbi:CDP-alcohol phosphatidyltransferase family protein [Microcella sp.]|uniref:CDP-alcohol phosphatidyltransferase family protein n=1 Tax=Microcella sp. TaxID=1913979 RepID=UPI00299F82D0|nr:CDP-alcohol phosphatidyltransferase family protein [Microcella sp.]MDX2026682.1 CDP-alcohol phosphatidyltransferase family protein [Microcella sp.]